MTGDQLAGVPILAIEERCLNAWPAAHTIVHDGWLLRLSDNYTRRANSVQPLYPTTCDLAAAIAYCEKVYAARGQDTIFKMTPAAQPAALDATLAALGYAEEAPTSVQTCALPLDSGPVIGRCTLDADLTDGWLDAFANLSDLPSRHRPAARHLLTRILPEHRFVALREGETIVAVALVVVEAEHAGVFDVVVHADYRRQGIGAALMRQSLQWAVTCGARVAELAVVVGNLPAQRVYAGLGFREAYRYWYRVKRSGA